MRISILILLTGTVCEVLLCLMTNKTRTESFWLVSYHGDLYIFFSVLISYCEVNGWHLIMCVHQAEPLCKATLTHTLTDLTTLQTSRLSTDRHCDNGVTTFSSHSSMAWLQLQQSKLKIHNWLTDQKCVEQVQIYPLFEWAEYLHSLFGLKLYTIFMITFKQANRCHIQIVQFSISMDYSVCHYVCISSCHLHDKREPNWSQFLFHKALPKHLGI